LRRVKLLSIIFFLSVVSCNEKDNVSTLVNIRDARMEYVKSDFKTKILESHGVIPNIDELAQVFDEQLDKSKPLTALNNDFQSLSDYLNIDLIDVRSNSRKESIVLNQILILDYIILKTKSSMNSLARLNPIVQKVEESADKAFYKVYLVASDTLFNPEFYLFTSSDTFSIQVDDQGVGFFNLEKQSKKHIHSFNGEVVVNPGSNLRYSFSYPTAD